MSETTLPLSDRAKVVSVSPIWLATGAIAIAVTSFLLVFPLAVGGDYPNHLARTHIEGWLAGSAALQEYFAVRLSFIPDLTMDMVIPWASHLLGTYSAGAIVCAAAIMLGPIAGVLISRRRHRDAGLWLPLLGFATVFSLNLEFGFINFLAANGLALLAFHYWMTAVPGWRRAFIFAPVGLFLTINHALGFLLFGYLVLLWEGAKFLDKERGSLRSFAMGLTVRDSLAFLPGLLFILMSVLGASDLEKALPPANIFGQRDVALLAPFRFYASGNSVITAFLSVVAIGGGLILGLRARILDIDLDMAIVCGGLGVLVLVMPIFFLGIWGLHFRFGASLIILLAASVRFKGKSEKPVIGGAIALGTLLMLQTANAVPNLVRTDGQLQAVRASVAGLPNGARVLPVSDGVADQVYANHAAALAVIEADAFVPNLFTNTSPVDVRDAYKRLHSPQGIPITQEALIEGLNKSFPVAENGYWSRDFYFAWPATFSHVLFIRSDDQKTLDFQELCLIAEGANHALYQIRRAPEAACETALTRRS